MKKVLIFLFTISVSCQSFGQDLNYLENKLEQFMSGLAQSRLDADRAQWNDSIHDLLSNQISNPEVFSHEFTTKRMGILKPDDHAFMIFNWNSPLEDGSSEFFGYVVLPREDRNLVIQLETYTREPKKVDSRYLEYDAWYGALYYDIIPVKKGKKTYYTLLGYSPSEKFVTTKYIDVLTIKDDEITFGAPIFKTEKGMKKRLIFKFSSEVSMSITFQATADRIVMDHLVPRMAGMQGNYQFYGPDGTFDAYVLNKSTWEYAKGVEFRAEKKSKRNYKDPRNRNRN